MRQEKDEAGVLMRFEKASASYSIRLVAQDLTCQRGGRIVFRNVFFALEAGEALVVTGPNGAGKSSLLRQLAGLVDVAGGELFLEGGLPDANIAEQAHYIGHLDALKAAMSVRETAEFWAEFLGGSEKTIDQALDAFDLVALSDLPVAYLSAGQRRRLTLSRLLIARRALWLLDEPNMALDAASLARLVSIMEAHLEGGGLIVAAMHQSLGLGQSRSLELAGMRTSA